MEYLLSMVLLSDLLGKGQVANVVRVEDGEIEIWRRSIEVRV